MKNVLRVGIVLMLVLALVSMEASATCGKCEGDKAKAGKEAKKDGDKTFLCAKCGQIKGGDACCKPDADKCAKCGLAKGAPGCCKIAKGTKNDVELCAKCGQIKDGDACCKPDAAKCDKCGLAKGSPGCCKMCKPKK